MIEIQVNNHRSRLMGDIKSLNSLHKAFSVRHPNAFYIRRSMRGKWDGMVNFISENGSFNTGLLPDIILQIEENGWKYRIKDNRSELKSGDVPEVIGETTLRKYQIRAIKSIVNNRVGGISFQRGIIDAAMNAGKTLIMMGVHLSFENSKTIILLNDSNLYNQFMEDMPKYFEDSEWGYMRGKDLRWGDIMICMVQTLVNRISVYQNELSNYNCVLVDECDLSDNKTYKKVLSSLYNTVVRVGLSGTVFLRKLAKDRLKNNNIKSFFGNVVFNITSLDLIEKGHSTPINVQIIMGNKKVIDTMDYPSEYEMGITKNWGRTRAASIRAENHLRNNDYPILVMCQYHNHVDRVFKYYVRKFGKGFKVAKVHHKTPNKKSIINQFKNGEIDILVSSLFIKRGQNMPLIKVIQNLSGGDNPQNQLQIIGRGSRKHETKEIVYYEDYYDLGKYLERHSKHRILYYRNQGFPVEKTF